MLSAVPASSLLRIFASNQLGTALACDVVPSPLKEHQQFVIEANQIVDMQKQPQYPCQETMPMPAAEIGDASIAPDDRQVPFVMIAKRWQVFRLHPLADELADIATLLDGHRRHAGQRFPILMGKMGQIANHENLGMARDGEVGLHLHPPG